MFFSVPLQIEPNVYSWLFSLLDSKTIMWVGSKDEVLSLSQFIFPSNQKQKFLLDGITSHSSSSITQVYRQYEGDERKLCGDTI